MANMSYCRFQNTLGDLRDCKDALEEILNGDPEEALSADEERAKKRLLMLCQEIAADYAEEPS